MADTTEHKVKITVETEASMKNLRALKKQLKDTAAGSDDFKKLSADIRDMEDALEGAKLGADDFAGALEAAPGPVGQLFQGLKKVEIATKSWGSALKATGIGLIVSLVGGLVAAFSQTEGSLKKLEPLLIGMEKIFGGIVEVMQPLLDIFLELALKALPYITDGIGKVYSGFVAFFTLIKEAGTGVGKVLKGIFTLDTDVITEGYEQIKGSLGKTVDAYQEGVKRFEAGTKKLTKTEKENAASRKEIADKALQDKLKALEAEDKLDEARLAKLKAEALVLADTEQKKLDVEKEFAKKAQELRLKDIADKQALYAKDSIEFKNLQADKIKAEADYTTQVATFAEQQKKINDDKLKQDAEDLKAKKDFQQKIEEILTATIADDVERQTKQRQDKLVKELAALEEDKQFIKLSETEKENIRKALRTTAENDITNIELTAEQDRLNKRLRLLELNGQALLSGTRAYYDNRRALISELENKELIDLKAEYDKKKLTAEEFERAVSDIKSKYTKQRKDNDTQELNQYLSYASNILSAVSNIFNAASEVAKMQQEQDLKRAKGNAEEEEKIRKKAFEQNKKTQIAQAIIGTLQAAIQAYQSLAVIPIVGPVLGAAAAAAALVFGYKKVSLIKSQTYESQASAGGAASAPSPSTTIAAPQIGGVGIPQIQGTQGGSTGTQIAATLSENSNKPMRAFVVERDISSQQALARRTSRAATFG
jgi:hypothetical protein